MRNPRIRKAVTIVDIARRLGISAMTVSRALTGNPEVSEATRKKVLGCADEMGYRPHRWARSLVTQKTSMVGVVIPDISHSFFAEVTRGIEKVLQKAGYNLLLCHSSLDPEKEKAEIDMLVGSRVEGLIVASEQPERTPLLFDELTKNGMAFVLADRFFPNRNFPSVVVDDLAVGRMAAEHLIGLGHRRIGHIQGPRLSPASLRHRGFLQALRAHKIRFGKESVACGNFDIPSGREAMHRLLVNNDRLTAVFAGNDPMAIGALYACREAGLRVPADVSIMGAGNIEGADHPNPFLTTMDWPREELGRAAAESLLAVMRNRADRDFTMKKVFQPRLLVRQSTGAPPA